MIPPELALQLQAHLDQELAPDDRAAIDRLLQQNPEANALWQELNHTRLLLRPNELPRSVPESREFYWSKIQRAIQSPAPSPHPARPSLTPWWLRLAVSLGAVALIALAILNLDRPPLPYAQPKPSPAELVDNAQEEATTITFRSDAEGLTVTWISGGWTN